MGSTRPAHPGLYDPVTLPRASALYPRISVKGRASAPPSINKAAVRNDRGPPLRRVVARGLLLTRDSQRQEGRQDARAERLGPAAAAAVQPALPATRVVPVLQRHHHNDVHEELQTVRWWQGGAGGRRRELVAGGVSWRWLHTHTHNPHSFRVREGVANILP